ncbi:MAG: hypothetical protein R8M46_00650 [Ghiorsea sp.]
MIKTKLKHGCKGLSKKSVRTTEQAALNELNLNVFMHALRWRNMKKPYLHTCVLTALLSFNFSSLANAEEGLAQHQMNHEAHTQHQLSDVQRGHIHHVHEAGSWMFEYRFMSMAMDGMLDGSKDVSAADVVKKGSVYKNAAGGRYMMAPTGMT